MNRTTHALLCIAFILLPTTSTADDPDARQTAALLGIHRMLDEDFSGAHALFDSLMAAGPDRPEFPFYQAMATWRRGLNLEDGARFDPAIRKLLARSIRLAKSHLRKHGDSAEMYLWLGNAYGLRTSLEMLRKEVSRGVVDGYRGRECLFEAIELDPELTDARFGIGLSDYILSQQPRLLRAVQRLFSLPSGDRKGGLEKLDRVSREGAYCRMDALSARAYIDLYYEHSAGSARHRFADLLRRYPNSLDYRIRYLDVLFALTVEHGRNHGRALVDSVQSIRRMADARGWRLTSWRRTKLIFVEGLAHYLLGDRDRAGERMAAYVRQAHPETWLLGPAELTLGKLADLEGNREGALAHYRRALKREDVWGSHTEAGTYLQHPFDGTEPESRPPDKSQRFPEMP